MAFHVVYSRHYWDHEDPGTFANSWTIYRNVPYSELFKMKDAIPSLKENADQVWKDSDLSATVSSGSVPTVGMVVVPCSANTLGKVSHGIADSLVSRAVHCHLKERRKVQNLF